MKINTVQKDSFQIVGIKWQGTYEQAGNGEIRQAMSQFRERMSEIPETVQPRYILGISVHDIPNGFTYYIGSEVKQAAQLPEGMISFIVPSQLYATLNHPTGEEVYQSYETIDHWIKQEGYQTVTEPINYLEVYPATYDPQTDQPMLTIMVPIKDD
ncbi:GyrI-like domain-containing protein [Brevibacillus ginsengisoli]|uniref:GyrI-like domain-containing protein n=1 Tax=Brevibacillus ginsengisoli TaxID=363854 RepID=UPI003CF7C454